MKKYWFFIGCFLITLLFIQWIVPYKVDNHDNNTITSSKKETLIPVYILWLCMAAIFISYINIGAYWVYIELASLSYGISESWTGGVLFWASLLTLVGCVFAAFFSKKYGLVKPLIGAQLMMIVIVGMLVNGITSINLLVSVFMFNFLWIFNDVFQMSTVATIDNKGSFAALIVGAQGLGQIVGPNIAASILGAQYGYSGVFLMCALTTALSVLVYLFMYKRLSLYAPKILTNPA